MPAVKSGFKKVALRDPIARDRENTSQTRAQALAAKTQEKIKGKKLQAINHKTWVYV